MNIVPYLRLTLISLQSNYFYLVETLLNNLALIFLITLSFVVNTTYFEDKNYAINYFIIANLINFTFASLRIRRVVSNLVISGRISSYLIKPFETFSFFFFYYLGKALSKTFSILVYTISLTLLFGYASKISIVSLLKIPIALLVSLAFYFYYYKLIFYIIVMFEKLDFIDIMILKLISFIGGGLFTTSIISENLKLLPFYYFVGFETDLVLGNVKVIHITLALIYLATLILLSMKVKRIALRKLEINGG